MSDTGPELNHPGWNQNNFYHVKPSYHEGTTKKPDDFYKPGYEDGNSQGGDDYVQVHTSHKPARPSFPGEISWTRLCIIIFLNCVAKLK